MANSFSSLPQIEKLLQEPPIEAWKPLLSRHLVSKMTAEAVEEFRQRIRDGEAAPKLDDIVSVVDSRCRKLFGRRLRRVINATGIVIHTNMGRSPISAEVWSAAADVNTNYSNLEMSLDTGKRDRRGGILGELLSHLLGCESSTVVNNCAAALYLVLASLAYNREVIVSRGEQVQIGGGFRIPEILRQSGAKLVEVGTTNITRAEDYAEAVGPDTAMVLLVHTSNFEIRGFTQKPSVADISRLIPPEVILAVDQGAGITTETIPDETKAARYFEDGADLVCFSGDKVLGGPQAGLISGKRDLIETIEKHPMMRVLRSGKTIRSLLEEHLVQKMNGTVRGRAEEISSIRADELLKRGEALIENIPTDCASVVESAGAIGGGSAPGKTFPTYSIRLDSQTRPETLLLELRSSTPPIVGTISDGSVLLNLSTITSEELPDVAAAITALHEAKLL